MWAWDDTFTSNRMCPASGRTVFHLASAVSTRLFETALAAFARQVGAGPAKQVIFVLDLAGRLTLPTLQVPEHLHLSFLPPYSPELQPNRPNTRGR